MNNDKMYLDTHDVMQLLGVKYWRAHKLIKDGNKILAERGKYTMSNLISKKFLMEFLGE